MDIKGAKALRDRLGPDRVGEAPPTRADVPEDAPPVYHWLGVGQANPKDDEDEPAARTASLFRRLGLSFR